MATTVEEFAARLREHSALTLGVERLYRFQRFDSAKLALLLSAKLIRASDPARFNDPFDCRPSLTLDSLEHPNALPVLEKLVRNVLEASGGRAELNQLESEFARLKGDPALRARLVPAISRSLTKAALLHRILCFGVDPFSLLLWAHYGDGHQGVALEFDSTKPPFGGAVQVKYEGGYPQLDFSNASPVAFAQVALLTKADCWAYENEFRLIANEVEGSIHVRCHKDLIDVPEGSLTSTKPNGAHSGAVFSWCATRRYFRPVLTADGKLDCSPK